MHGPQLNNLKKAFDHSKLQLSTLKDFVLALKGKFDNLNMIAFNPGKLSSNLVDIENSKLDMKRI